MKRVPNIFEYATSELSQDAFILWLLDWANPHYEETDADLCHTAQDFVRKLLNNHALEVESIVCHKQEKHIDVFAIINDKYALIIEDKTNTSEHSNQLKRYSEWVSNKYTNLELHCVYYKTGNESKAKLSKLKETYHDDFPDVHFSIISRIDILEVVSNSRSNNAILDDYRKHIQSIQNSTDLYKSAPYQNWSYLAWQGFYMRLEDELRTGDWGYVSNPSGGFLGYWWHQQSVRNDSTIDLYLQFEQDKLCIKAYSNGESRPQFGWTNRFVQNAKELGLPVNFPHKRRTGTTMTLAVVDLDYILGDVSMNAVIEKLHKIEQLVDDASSSL